MMPDRREQLIVELLKLRGDAGFQSTLQGVKGDTGSVPIQSHGARCQMRHGHGRLRCTCWLRHLDELTRCLRLMRAGHPHGLKDARGLEVRGQWYAVYERYVAAARKPMQVQVSHFKPLVDRNVEVIGLLNKTDLNKRGDGETRVLVEVWRDGLDPVRITEGVRWLSREFRGAPELPVEMLDAA